MNKVIDVCSSIQMDQYDALQYNNFVKLSNLFEEFIFYNNPVPWESVVENLGSVLNNCDKIDYQSDAIAMAYSVWHFLDRYHRMQMMCKFLLEHGFLNRSKQYDVLDVGAGPSQVLFAISDHFMDLNCIGQKILCTVNPDYVEKSCGFRNFLHHFVEFSQMRGQQYMVPYHHGRTDDFLNIKFNILQGRRRRYIKYRYDITIFNNFFTTKKCIEDCAEKFRQICKYTRNHGLVIVIGASEKSRKYKEIYPIINKNILKKRKDRYFYCRWDKVFDQEFNCQYNDKYGEILKNYFSNVMRHLKEINLWEIVPDNAQKEFLKNITMLAQKDGGKQWKGVTWKMVVYQKKSKPFGFSPQKNALKNHNSMCDGMWKEDIEKSF